MRVATNHTNLPKSLENVLFFLTPDQEAKPVYSRERIEGKKPFWAVDRRTGGLEIAPIQENTGKYLQLRKFYIFKDQTCIFKRLFCIQILI